MLPDQPEKYHPAAGVAVTTTVALAGYKLLLGLRVTVPEPLVPVVMVYPVACADIETIKQQSSIPIILKRHVVMFIIQFYFQMVRVETIQPHGSRRRKNRLAGVCAGNVKLTLEADPNGPMICQSDQADNRFVDACK